MERLFYNRYAIISVLFIALLFLSCKSKKPISDESVKINKPVGLVLQKIIEGEVLGEEINRPTGVVADNFGNIYFLDSGNDRIVNLDDEYRAIREGGGFGSDGGLLSAPKYLTVDNNLNVVISDAGNQRLSVYDNHLNFAYMIELKDDDNPFKFGRPAGILVTDFGEKWIADPENSRLIIFNHLDQFDRFIGTVDLYADLFRQPTAVCKGRGNEVVVADSENGSIFVFNNGLLENEFGYDYLLHATGIVCDKDNRVWVVDSEFPGVYCFSYGGEMLFSEGRRGSESDYSFNSPTDISVLSDDRIIISDTGNDRLMVYKILFM